MATRPLLLTALLNEHKSERVVPVPVDVRECQRHSKQRLTGKDKTEPAPKDDATFDERQRRKRDKDRKKREKNKLAQRACRARKKLNQKNLATMKNSNENGYSSEDDDNGYSSEGYSSDYSVASGIPSTPPVKQMYRTAVPPANSDEFEVPSTPSKPHGDLFFLAMQQKNALRMEMIKQSTELSKGTQLSLLESKKGTQSSLLKLQKGTDAKIEATGKAAQERQNKIYNDGISDLDEIMSLSRRNLLPDIQEEKELTPTKMNMNASASPSASGRARKPTSLPSPAGRKRAASPAASASRKKLKAPPRSPSAAATSAALSSRSVRPPPALEPIFAARPLECLSDKELCLDEQNAPDKHWEFNLHDCIIKINTNLKAEDSTANYKYFVVGVRNSPLQSTFRALGISPAKGVTPNTAVTLPHIVVHAMLDHLPDPEEVYVEDDGKFGKTIFTSGIGIGKKHTWEEVTVPALPGVTIKVLHSNYKRSKRTIRGMNDTDELLATCAQVWFKPKFDMNNTNPFETFKLTIPPEEGVDEDGEPVELKGEDEMYIDLDDFKEARTLVLTEKIAILDVSPNPNWNPNWTTKEKKKKVWNDMYLEADDDKWYADFLCDTMINHFISQYEDELAHIKDAHELVKEESERALKDHLPTMQQQYPDYSSEIAQKIRMTTKHYKIFPSNKEFKHTLNRGNLGHINSMVGNATAVFPEAAATLPPPKFEDNESNAPMST